MKERPILFSAPMVQAILAGTKTQTRRVVKPQPWAPRFKPDFCSDDEGIELFLIGIGINPIRCPYGNIGDQLWVRETWQPWRQTSAEYNQWEPLSVKDYDKSDSIEYKATSDSLGPWKPSIHMPRKASRIQLEITGVRVERLQNINRGDCMAEGCPFPNIAQETDPKKWYMDLWESINGAGSWAANPWVWVIEFRVIK